MNMLAKENLINIYGGSYLTKYIVSFIKAIGKIIKYFKRIK